MSFYKYKKLLKSFLRFIRGVLKTEKNYLLSIKSLMFETFITLTPLRFMNKLKMYFKLKIKCYKLVYRNSIFLYLSHMLEFYHTELLIIESIFKFPKKRNR